MPETVVPRTIEADMKESYIDYAMSVIVGRALPDVRDGLKPVHRRILYAMYEESNTSDKPFKKSARIVGATLGKYHPHGDTAIYDSLVRMAQNFSLRYKLINGQGNWGCFAKDTKVKLVDGRELNFEELIKEDRQGKTNCTYTIDKNGEIKIAPIRKPRLTLKNANLMRVILDNGQEIRCTRNHKFMLRNGEYTEAQNLKSGDSLMPIYSKITTKQDSLDMGGYEMVLQPAEGRWEYTHHLADQFNLERGIYAKSLGTVRHHKDFNKRNNNPENIVREHPEKRKEFSERLTNTLKRSGQNSDYQKLTRTNIIRGNKNHVSNKTGKLRFIKICKKISQSGEAICEQNYERFRNIVYPYGHATAWKTALEKYFNNDQNIVLAEINSNHKVIRTELLNECEDVYDLTVDETHNFALATGVFVHNSIDGDNPAAMRYTECKLMKIAEEMLQDIEKETVDFADNFDGTTKEPVLLPAKIPNLLINGSTGIAVGMATSIPPHNLTEVVDAAVAVIDGAGEEKVLSTVTGPDFPTGGIVVGRSGILQAYKTGRGTIKLRAKAAKDEKKNAIIVSEIPYQITKTAVIESIVEAVKTKKIEGISGVHDRSDKQGMEVIIDIKKGHDIDVVLNQLYVHTQLQTTFGIINLALVGKEPKLLGIHGMISEFIKFRKQIVRKRSEFDLKEAQARAHILEGLRKALENIDPVVALLRASKDVADARGKLMKDYSLSDLQANAILDMKLSKLIALEREKIDKEYKEFIEKINWLKEVLADEIKINNIIKQELAEIKSKYGDCRRTQIIDAEDDEGDIESLIPNNDVVVTISNRGYVKRIELSEYRAQNRGGKGVIGTETKEEDVVQDVVVTKNHNYLLLFTDQGRAFWLKVYKIPESSRYATGKTLVSLLDLKDEKVTSWITVEKFDSGEYLMMVTKNGIVKRTALDNFSNVRKTGIIAITLKEADRLVEVIKTDGKQEVIIATAKGQAIRFKEEGAREIGRMGQGVIGIRFSENGDEVIGITSCKTPTILTITENGFGKRTHIDEYRVQGRGGSGIINIKVEGRNGNVVGVKNVRDEDEIIVISSKGQVIRTFVGAISVIGRNTQGVRIIRLAEGEKVASFAVVAKDQQAQNGESNGGNNPQKDSQKAQPALEGESKQ